MIHLTPVQFLGYSKSAYSLRNQLCLDERYIENATDDGWAVLKQLIDKFDQEYGILTISDLVLNHTASNSEWISEHPECGYNLVNSPYLTGAYVLDRILWNISLEASEGALKSRGLPKEGVSFHNDYFSNLREYVWEKINQAKIHEFYLLDVNDITERFLLWLRSNDEAEPNSIPCPNCKPQLKQHCSHHANREKDEIPLGIVFGGPKSRQRYGATVDFTLLLRIFFKTSDKTKLILNKDAGAIIREPLTNLLTRMNNDKYHEISNHLSKSVENFLANFSYRFLDENGPRLNEVSHDSPFMWNYFYQKSIDKLKSLDEIERECQNESEAINIMVYNGWVMGDDPMKNFAEEPSNVYLRRELIVWGDSVKLRYGHSRDICPFLWDHMKEYSEMTAKIFHGIRLDNCHSTPIHVAQYMLDAARRMRENLYVIAELFTGSERIDNIFVNKLGINSLIREALQVNSCHELGSQSHHYGASQPAGSFTSSSSRSSLEYLRPKIAHGLFYDMTHDNKSPAVVHSLHDYLPTAAVMSTVCCAIASTRGFDEMVPHQIDVVTEERPYSRLDMTELSVDHGILRAKATLNNLHRDLNIRGYNQTFIDQVAENVLAISRFCPETGASIVTVTHSAMRDPGLRPPHFPIKKIRLNGFVKSILMEGFISDRFGEEPAYNCDSDLIRNFVRNPLVSPLNKSMVFVN